MNRLARSFALAMVTGAALAATGAACGSGDDRPHAAPIGTGGGGFGPVGAGPSGPSQGATSSAGSMMDSDAACASETYDAALTPVDVLLVWDRSGSMAAPTSTGTRWTDTTTALEAFIADPASAGLKVAIRFFDDETPPICTMSFSQGCDPNDPAVLGCASPNVPIGLLTDSPAPQDVQEEKLLDSIDAHQPGGGTPMWEALAGGEKFAEDYQAQHPKEEVVVVLITDGEPNGCTSDVSEVALLAGDALAKSKVLTYAVGLTGSNEASMDLIAQQGGTNAAFIIGDVDAAKELEAAMKKIGGEGLSCTFPMPKGKNGPVDPKAVAVEYSPGGKGPPVPIQLVSSSKACSKSGGFYYDAPAHPKTLTLCPSSCSTVVADPAAKIDIVVGCPPPVN